MFKPKWKSPVVWTTLAALVFWVVKNWVGFEIPGWDNFVNLALAAALALGILNNPNSTSFS